MLPAISELWSAECDTDTVISPLTVVLREADDSGKVGDRITTQILHVTIDGVRRSRKYSLTIRTTGGGYCYPRW